MAKPQTCARECSSISTYTVTLTEEITDKFVQDTNLISQTLTSSSIVTYTVTLTEEITDMFAQDTNIISFTVCT